MAKAKRKTTGKTTRSVKKTYSPDKMNELIQQKAYELYERRGYSHGYDWADWIEAERLVKSGKYK